MNRDTLSLSDLIEALQKSWSATTSYESDEHWSSENPARGQCVVSSLVVQDYFGGNIVRYAVTGDGIDETHYFNVLENGTVIDTTRSQYESKKVSMVEKPIDLAKNSFNSVRQRCLADEETNYRYSILKERVKAACEAGHA
jgi:hypothetical protein